PRQPVCRLRRRPGGAGHPLFFPGERGLLPHHGDLRHAVPAGDRGQPPAGRASDLRPPVTPVRLHGGPAGGGSLRRPHRGLLRRCDCRWGRGLQRLPGNPLGSAAGGPGHECPPPGLAHLQPTECAGGLRRH
ncbi:DUF6809 domain-containing protein, partial [Dysosmobacter welbionis]